MEHRSVHGSCSPSASDLGRLTGSPRPNQPGEACLDRLLEVQCGCVIGKKGSPGRPWAPFPRIKMFSSFYSLVTTKLTSFLFNSINIFFFEQVQGLGTALKILFSGHELDDGKFNKSSQFHLKRTEIVSLFNAFGR